MRRIGRGNVLLGCVVVVLCVRLSRRVWWLVLVLFDLLILI